MDEIGNISADDAQAHLDIFAERLRKERDSRGVLIAYHDEDWPPGMFLRTVYGYADYLINKRGIAPDDLEVTVGVAKRQFSIELWLVPKQSPRSGNSVTSHFRLDKLTQFDDVLFGDDCWPQFTLELYEPSDTHRFFASALQGHANMKGLIVVHPRRSQNDRESRNVLRSTTTKLTTEYSISPSRVISSLEKPRDCGELQLWLVPTDFAVPNGQTVRDYVQSQFLAEAENRYTIRRLEFVGNRYTRDDVIRRAINLQEGEIFTTAMLRKSLASVSRLSMIRPVRMGDVDVRVDRTYMTIDFALHLRERPSAQRQRRGRR